MRRAGVVFLLAGLAFGPAAAAHLEPFGSVGFSIGRTQNPRFENDEAVCSDVPNPNYDPNSQICRGLDPGDPIPPQCQEFVAPTGRSGGSMVGGDVALTLGLDVASERARFDIAYMPRFFYYQDSTLTDAGHGLASHWTYDASPRNTLRFSEEFDATPEQEVDPDRVQNNSLFITRTDQLLNRLRAGWEGRAGGATFDVGYHHLLRKFSDDPFVDTSNHNGRVGLSAGLGRTGRTYISTGYEYSIFSFSDGISTDPNDLNDPNAQADPPPLDTVRHQAGIGFGYSSVSVEGKPVSKLERDTPGRPRRDPRRGVAFGVEGGMHRLEPSRNDAGLEERTSPYVNASLSVYSSLVATIVGYSSGLTDGGGAFANADSRTTYATVRIHFAPAWEGELAASHNDHERVEYTENGMLGDESVISISGRAALEYRITERWSATGSYTYFKQSIDGDPCTIPGFSRIPELSSSRYLLGLLWHSD